MTEFLKQWRVDISDHAKSQLKKMDKPIQQRISSYLDKIILNYDNPRLLGDPLKGKLDSYWRYRVGDYRILCILEDETITVHVMKIGHRKEVYNL